MSLFLNLTFRSPNLAAFARACLSAPPDISRPCTLACGTERATDRAIGTASGTCKRGPGGPHGRAPLVLGRDATSLLAYKAVSAKGHAAKVLADVQRLRAEGRV